MGKKSYSINYKVLWAIIFFIGLVATDMLLSRSYFDEIVGIICFIYVTLTKKKKIVDQIIYMLSIFVIIIGVFSNLNSHLLNSAFYIIIDIIAEFKVPFTFLAFKIAFNDENKADFTRYLNFPAKLYILISFVFGILTLFMNTGMYSQKRFGIPAFHFIYPTAYQFATVTMACIYIIMYNNKCKNKKIMNRYVILGMVNCLLTTKGPQIIFIAVFYILMIYLKKREKISLKMLVLLGIIISFLGMYQINNYLLKENTPRSLFYKYSFITANRYFPLGSGFGTFGSDVAARNYSKLYYSYGFDKKWGMTPDDGWFLSDNFWPTPIAQFGWIFGGIYILIYIAISLEVKNNIKDSTIKAFVYAMIFQYYIHAVGSAILSSASGVIGFLILGIAISNNNKEEQIDEKDTIDNVVQ